MSDSSTTSHMLWRTIFNPVQHTQAKYVIRDWVLVAQSTFSDLIQTIASIPLLVDKNEFIFSLSTSSVMHLSLTSEHSRVICVFMLYNWYF